MNTYAVEYKHCGKWYRLMNLSSTEEKARAMAKSHFMFRDTKIRIVEITESERILPEKT